MFGEGLFTWYALICGGLRGCWSGGGVETGCYVLRLGVRGGFVWWMRGGGGEVCWVEEGRSGVHGRHKEWS